MAIVNYFGQPTPHATIHTKGSWEELTASTASQIARIKVALQGNTGAEANHLIDIGTGAASSEVVLINNLLLASNFDAGHNPIQYEFPVNIPASTRIVVRSQASVTALDSNISIMAYHQATSDSGTIYTMGADTSDSGGLVVDPGTDTGVKGAWVEFEDSTPADFKWLCLAVGSRANTAMTTNSWNFDIGTGAAAAEAVLIPDIGCGVVAANDIANLTHTGAYEVDIPAGTRIAVRCRSFLTADATDRLLDVVLYGGNQPLYAPAAAGGGTAMLVNSGVLVG